MTTIDIPAHLRVGAPVESLDRLIHYTTQNGGRYFTPRQRRRFVRKARRNGDAVALRDALVIPVRGRR